MDKKKQRDSNMELLRIIAMLLVMILHTDLISFDGLNVIDTVSQPTFSFLRKAVKIAKKPQTATAPAMPHVPAVRATLQTAGL